MKAASQLWIQRFSFLEFRSLGLLREFDNSSVFFFFFFLFPLIPLLIQFCFAILILILIVGVWDTENGRKENGGSRDF